MPSEEIQYRTVSVDEALETVRETAWLEGLEIADLSEFLETLAREYPGKEVHIIECRILDCDCLNIEIHNPLNVQETVFARDVRFLYSTFQHKINFFGVTFAENADFTGTRFMADAAFTGSTFVKDTVFSESIFYAKAFFTSVSFHDSVSFFGVSFRQEAGFHLAKFVGGISFWGATLGGKLDLTGSHFQGDARLNLAGIDRAPGRHFVMTIDQIGRYQRPAIRSRWPGRKGFRRPLYKCLLRIRRFIRHSWPSVRLIEGEDSSEAARLHEAMTQYNMLRDNFRILPSCDTEEDRCHYKYKDLARRSTKGHRFWRLWDWAVMKWCLGYGIYAKRVLFAAAGTVFFFALLYALAASVNTISGYEDGQFNALYFSVITFTTTGYGDYTPLGWLRILAGLEAFLGLVLMAVFTVTFARKLIS